MAGYMVQCAAATDHLVIFDCSKKPWQKKAYRQREEFKGTPLKVWGM